MPEPRQIITRPRNKTAHPGLIDQSPSKAPRRTPAQVKAEKVAKKQAETEKKIKRSQGQARLAKFELDAKKKSANEDVFGNDRDDLDKDSEPGRQFIAPKSIIQQAGQTKAHKSSIDKEKAAQAAIDELNSSVTGADDDYQKGTTSEDSDGEEELDDGELELELDEDEIELEDDEPDTRLKSKSALKGKKGKKGVEMRQEVKSLRNHMAASEFESSTPAAKRKAVGDASTATKKTKTSHPSGTAVQILNPIL